MKCTTRLTLIAATTCLFPVATVLAADPAAVADIVDRQIKPLMEEYDIPGMAVAVTVDGEEYFFNYGVASLDAQTPVTQDTVFEIGSVSKIFTSMLGTHADAVGKLSLNDHPGEYLPDLDGSPLDRATLLNFATYTAGNLPLQFPDTVGSDAEVSSYYAQFEPDTAPGEHRRYSNPSIGLFGHITALAMEGEFADLIQETLFDPLGLESSFIEVPEEAMERYAWGYNSENEPIRVNPGVLDGEAYGVKSSAADLIRLVQAHIQPEDLDETMRRTIEGTQIGYFKIGEMVQGLGWEQYPYPIALDRLLAGNSATMAMEVNAATELTPPLVPSEPRLFNKTGSTGGFGAYVAFVPEANVGVVMLANKNYPNPARVTAGHAILAELTDWTLTSQLKSLTAPLPTEGGGPTSRPLPLDIF